jgi:O-antigen ligase
MNPSRDRRLLTAVPFAVAVAVGCAIAVRQDVVTTVAALAALVVLAVVFTPEQLLVFAAVMIPFRVVDSFIPVTRGGVTLADGFLFAFTLSVLARRRGSSSSRVPVMAAGVVLALLVVGSVSMFYGGFYVVGLRKLGRILLVGLSFVAARRYLDVKQAERVAKTFVVASGASAIAGLALMARAAGAVDVGLIRLWGGVEDPNHMSVVLAAAILLALAWRPRGITPSAWTGIILAMLIAQVASLSRGGALALGVGLATMVGVAIYARFHGRDLGVFGRSGISLIVLGGTGAAAVSLIPPQFTDVALVRYQGLWNPQTDPTGALRLNIWNAGFKMLARSPLLGVGPGAFGAALVASGAFAVPWEAHNSFVEIAVETGYLGLAAVFLALIVGAVLAIGAMGRVVAESAVDDAHVSLSTGLLAACVCAIAGGFSLSNILYEPLFVAIVILLIACLSARQEGAL